MSSSPFKLPKKGASKFDVLGKMESYRDRDVRWREGRAFSLVFYPGDEILELLKEAYTLFFSENGLNPSAFPSLRKFETEVVAMTAGVLGGSAKTAGNMTTGGTESILMAMKTAREWARANRPEIKTPEIIVPTTAHPAFDKAGHYFDLKITHIPTGPDYRADVKATAAAIGPDTIALVGSAPQYPQGVLDPIKELAALAKKKKILMHVDACVGGFMLPFVRKVGYKIDDFDFRVSGVTSMSVDLHKYAYAAKGASVVLYRDRELRRHQYFVTTEWPGGMYGSPTMTGTRAGGSIAAAWAVLNFLGEDGYVKYAREVMQAVEVLKRGIADIPGLFIPGEPVMSVMSIASDDEALDIYQVGDEMSVRGWHLDRQQFPASLHLTVSHAHTFSKDQFLSDLRDAVATCRKRGPDRKASAMTAMVGGIASILPEKVFSKLMAAYSKFQGAGVPKRSAAMYGMMGSLPNRGDLSELVMDFLDKLTTPRKD